MPRNNFDRMDTGRLALGVLLVYIQRLLGVATATAANFSAVTNQSRLFLGFQRLEN